VTDRKSKVKRRLTRDEMWARTNRLAKSLHGDIRAKAAALWKGKLIGPDAGFLGMNIGLGHDFDLAFCVQNVRPVRRFGPDGRTRDDLLVQVVQCRPAYLSDESQKSENERYRTVGYQPLPPPFRECDFEFRGGVTLIVDSETYEIRYAIEKNILSDQRLNRQRAFMSSQAGVSMQSLYFGQETDADRLAHLHACER
jgi:hypothetical protein